MAPPAPSSPAVDGLCGDEPGLCRLGVPSPAEASGGAIGWSCLGVGGGAPAACSVDLSPLVRESVAVERPSGREAVAGPEAQRRAAQRTAGGGQIDGAEPAGQRRVARGRQRIADLLAAKARRTPAQRKVGSRLLERAAAVAATGRDPAAERVRDPGPAGAGAARDTGGEDDRVLADIRAEVTAEVLARIRELGGSVVNSVPRYRAIRARLPITSVERLAALAAVRAIRTADEARTQQDQASAFPLPAGMSGSDPVVTRAVDVSEGDVAHRADVARRTHGVDGAGIGIGVLSNGVETLAARQAAGDLPAQVTVLPGQAGTGDEGTAMLEIVHDLAPGAELYFATAYGGQAQFGANIEALCEAGADVIVDDVYYFVEPVLQDGVITQGIDAAAAGGCFHFSPAGNFGNLNDGTSSTWEGDYAAGTPLIVDGETVGTRHDFGGRVEENRLRTVPFESYFVLQWSDPLGASANDYDLFLVNERGDVLASSTDTQDGTQDPVEFLSTTVLPGSEIHLVVVKASGADRYLRLQALGGRLQIATAGNTFGHLAAENAFGVGQVDVRTAGGDGGVFDGTESVRTASSDGPRRMFFEADGTAITPGDFSSTGGKLLQKPDLAAASCVSTSTPGFSRFCGTSAAAPHAAAVAALMLEAAGGPASMNLTRLRTAMAGAALDIEAAGTDRDSGAGIVMAAAAVDAVDVPPADRNRAPAVATALRDRTVAPGSAAMEVDLTDTFSDPDGDTLAYKPAVSDPDRLALSRNGTQVTLTPGSPGRVLVTLRATDPDGLSAVVAFTVTVQAGTRDYDGDNDGLIDVGTPAQLDAVRYDLDGDGLVDGATWMPYYAAFPLGALEMGCPADDGCTGYELTADLDFDTDGDGDVDSGDDYWNGGAGWAPIGDLAAPFTADFDGNGRGVSNLFIDRPAEDAVGLFGVSESNWILDVGLAGVDVTGGAQVGSLVGFGLQAQVRGSHAAGRVSGGDEVGGLAGRSWGELRYSHAAVDVSGGEQVGGLVGRQTINDVIGSRATGSVSGDVAVGGLVGAASGVSQAITASYATGRVSGTDAVGGLVGVTDYWLQSIVASYAIGDVAGRGTRLSDADFGCRDFSASGTETPINGGGVGGLVGSSCAYIERSYAGGRVSGAAAVGGLVGTASFSAVVRVSYWDLETSGVRAGTGEDDANENGMIDGAERRQRGAVGLTTAELQAPTDYTGIYGTWRYDLDRTQFGLPRASDPWDFGTSTQYPVLRMDLNGDRRATWQEFGYQVRDAVTLTAATTEGQARVVLSWTAPSTSAWSPAPDVGYTLYRDDGITVEAIATNLAGLTHADTDVTIGDRYEYRVAVVVDGGEAVRSAPVSVTAGAGNQPPVAVGIVADRELEVGSAAVVVDVAGSFDDPDGDTLTYGVSSSSTSVAAVSRSDAMVTITPGSAGRSIVTVTATDAGGSNTAAAQRFGVTVGYDYDADGDGLIGIGTLAQLDAVRHDLDGDGAPSPAGSEAYAAAFGDAFDRLGCGADGCSGYELLADLDFDTDGDGAVDPDDDYWNAGEGWEPIGPPVLQFLGIDVGGLLTTFRGNGHTLANLFIAREDDDDAGLFGDIGLSGAVYDVELTGVDVAGGSSVGGLAGQNWGTVVRVRATGRVTGRDEVGGLVGRNRSSGAIDSSGSRVAVTGRRGPAEAEAEPASGAGGLVGSNDGAVFSSFAAGRTTGENDVGGLVGRNGQSGSVRGSHASGRVAGGSAVGGLVGYNDSHPVSPRRGAGEVHGSYATGSVAGAAFVSGLVGFNDDAVISTSYATSPVTGMACDHDWSGLFGCGVRFPTASYWDSDATGRATGAGARTTAQLQAPTGYGGLYGSWKIDVDGDGASDDPWRFGTTVQYPVLAADLDGDEVETWEEFGYQLRAGPTLTATATETGTAGQAQVALSWTGVDVSHWDPAPDVTYTVTRAEGDTVEVLAEDLAGLEHDDAARTGTAFTYQVTAVVDGGEPARSAVVAVNTPGNSPPLPVGTLPARWLHVGDTASVEFGEAFEDPEGDALTYTVSSSATGVAAVSLSGTRVSITPLAEGEATITVTATDAGGSGASAAQAFEVTVVPASATDYDADDDGLIEIRTPAQLDAVRYDLDGDGAPTADGATAYAAAFATDGERQACGGPDGCVGYELEADLDFDTNGNGSADPGDTYWNGGAGWEPLGAGTTTSQLFVRPVRDPFLAVFEGNGHTIANLFIDRDSELGLFGTTGEESVIRHVGLIDVSVAGDWHVGALAGIHSGAVIGSYATGVVSGTGTSVGGLVGENRGSIAASYAAASVTGRFEAGGVAGWNTGTLIATYAAGRVRGEKDVGGLVGGNERTITASYATGPVSGDEDVGGLVGHSGSEGAVTASYWDTTTSRRTSGSGGQGRTTAQLQSPTDASGLYAQWDVDLDGDGAVDDPWRFGTDAQYPVLAVDADGAGGATWEELGHQLRDAPGLTAADTLGRNEVVLTWTAPDATHWTSAPDVTYTVTRDDGTAVTVVAEGIGGLTTGDTDVFSGGRYTYQVSALAAGGSAAHSAPQSVTVVGNRPPAAAGKLGDLTREVSAGWVDLDVSGAFSDADLDVLTFAASSSAPLVASVEVTPPSTVRVTPLRRGTAAVTVTATDGVASNPPAAQTFVVTVPNQSPVAGAPLPDHADVEAGTSPFEVPLAGAFRDADGDTLTYGVTSSAPSVATAVLDSTTGSTVLVAPLSGGEAVVTVTASDGIAPAPAEQTFTVTVANRPPVAEGTLAALTLRVPDVGTGAAAVDVSGAFSDPDMDDLTYSATVNPEADGSVATVEVAGSTLTVTPLSGGAATVTVTAEDPGGLSATQTLAVTVENRPPVATDEPLDDLLALEVPGTVTVNVSGAFEDPDGDALTYAARSLDTAVVTVSVAGSTVTVTPVSRGTATVEVTATDVDGSNESAQRTFEATVANRSPQAEGTLPALTRRVGEGEAEVEVSGAFEDPDGDPLTYGAMSSDPSAVSVSVPVNSSTVKVRPLQEGGTSAVTVTATDGVEGTTPAEQTFRVTVPENVGPEAEGTLEDKALVFRPGEPTEALAVEVSGAFSDPDRDVLTYGATSSDPSVVSVSVSGSVVTLRPENQGTATVTVTARDAGGSNTPAEQAFGVTVGGNRSPEPVGTLPAVSLSVVGDSSTVEVSNAFRDRDGDALTYAAESSDTSVAAVSVSASTLTVRAESSGAAQITVTATDAAGSNTSATQVFAVTVANQPPRPSGSPLPPLSLTAGEEPPKVDLSVAFEDPEDDALTYGARVTNPPGRTVVSVSVSVSGSEATVVPESGGTAQITVTATDAGGSKMTAERTFAATVANRAPVATGRLEALALAISDPVRSVPVSVSDAFEDPDGDALTYAAVSSDVSVATVEVSGSAVRVTALSSGTAVVTVTAEDGGGLQAEQVFGVTVANRSPLAVAPLPALSLQTVEGAALVELSGAFEDPDGDALTYGASSSSVTVAAVSVSGSSVTVTPLSRGFSTVTVSATDEGASNESATQAFGVSVDGGGSGGGGGGGGSGNRGPEAVGTLADRVLEVGEALRLDLSAAFEDRDGDALTYGAESSSADVAAVAVAGGVATVTGSTAGESTVTLTATDATGSNRTAEHAFMVTVGHDADGDGLLGVHTAAQLDAVRHDLDGDGAPTAAGSAGYGAAFGLASGETRTCAAAGGCRGYELGGDVDLDTNGSGGPDTGDAFWYGGSGWLPLGSAGAPFAARFEGNGHRVRGLFIARGGGAGLFGETAASSVIRHVGVTGADVSGADAAGALAGVNRGTVTGGFAAGRVSGSASVGGLVGANTGLVGGSFAAAEVWGGTSAGGLVGTNDGRIAGSYATGRVSGAARVGGLVGHNRSVLTAGYATGPVSGDAETGGLVGVTELPGRVTAGYWDTDTSGVAASASGVAAASGQGRPTAALQAPADYADLYAEWDVDVDGDGVADTPWDFGTDAQYPALVLDADGDGRPTWEELGHQLRSGPAVTAAPGVHPAQVALRWTAAGAGAWTPPAAGAGAWRPAPAVTYTVYRAAGAAFETVAPGAAFEAVASGVRGLGYADRGVEPGASYAYQVAAAVDGGEGSRSAPVTAAVPCAYTVTPLHRDVLWPASTGVVEVATGSTCAWTAASESGFLALTGGASGIGSGTVTYAVAANAGGPRTGSLLVAGRRVTVFQASPTVFADHPIERGVTPVRAIHFRELRARIDALRTAAGLAAFGWTDAVLAPGVTPVKGVHVTELRAALAEAYAAAGHPLPAYTDAALSTGATGIRAAHLMELRAAVLTLEAARRQT